MPWYVAEYAVPTALLHLRFANFRDAVSIQLYDETSGTAGAELPLNDTVEASMDSYGVKRIPSVMQIGDVIQVALGDTPGSVRRFVFCYLAYPTHR
jgi:hypothetical protein